VRGGVNGLDAAEFSYSKARPAGRSGIRTNAFVNRYSRIAPLLLRPTDARNSLPGSGTWVSPSNVLTFVETFHFQNPGVLWDGELKVVLTSTHLPNGAGVEVPTYCFTLAVEGDDEPAGHIHLRIGHTQNLELYQGHIGYGVIEKWRGRHFAERATRLLLPLAASHGIDPLWITCDPDN
jgi:hypothetical protein